MGAIKLENEAQYKRMFEYKQDRLNDDGSLWDCVIVDENGKVLCFQGDKGMKKQRAESYRKKALSYFKEHEIQVLPTGVRYGDIV